MPTVIDICCGSGGFSYGFKKAGYNILLGIDNEESKLKTYKKNITSNVLLGDISKIAVKEIMDKINNDKIDIIIGSPPCIQYSTSNPKRITIENQKNKNFFPLCYEFFFIVISLRPKVFVMENVPGFYESRDFNIITNLFNRLGYTTYLNVINVKDFGVPQNRVRGFFIGTLVNRKVELIPKDNIKEVTLNEAIGDLEGIKPINGYTMESLQLQNNFDYSDYQKLMHPSSENAYIYNHTMPDNKEITRSILENLKSGSHYKENKSHRKSYGFEVSKLITTKFDTPSGDGETMHYSLPRCLTLREAARIQSFDDEFIFMVEGLNKSQIRKLVGDAVPPLMGKYIGEILKDIIK